MSEEVVMVVRLQVKPGQKEALMASMEKLVAASQPDDGVSAYEWFMNESEEVTIIERYANPDALMSHLMSVFPLIAPMMGQAETLGMTVYGDVPPTVRSQMRATGATFGRSIGGFNRAG